MTHINSQLNLKLLGKQDIRQQLSSAYRLNIKQYSEKISHNRYILNKIIQIVLNFVYLKYNNLYLIYHSIFT
jgi:hypothetical protein